MFQFERIGMSIRQFLENILPSVDPISVKIGTIILKLKFFFSCHSQIGLVLTKMVKNRSFWNTHGPKSGFLELFCVIMSYFFLNLCLKLYRNTFLWFKPVFDHFFVRKTVRSRETPQDGLFSKSFIIIS